MLPFRTVNTDLNRNSTVYIVDDDQAIRHAMELLMRSVGLDYDLDIRMPGLGGLELQEKLNEMGSTLPIIFITGHGDVPMAVEAMQKGAVDFIQKPFRDQELLDQISEALKTDQERRSARDEKTEVSNRLEKLTKREREVMDLVVTGKPNKVIAYELGVSQRTVVRSVPGHSPPSLHSQYIRWHTDRPRSACY
jgi:FixJ family two-component response regulator